MQLKDRIRMQLEEAFGPVNRWYCSEHHRREVTDAETLVAYYIKHGGAEHFARNRCSKASKETADSRPVNDA
jgi:hypothetical protein